MAPCRSASPSDFSPFWAFSDEVFPCRCCSPLLAMEEGFWVCRSTEWERSWKIVDEPAPQCWADMVDADFEQQRATETPAEKAAREAAIKAEEEARHLVSESAKMYRYAETQKVFNSVGKGKDRHIEKKACPCKWLYCDEKAPRSQWRKNENGELCAPVRQALTGAACWAWEYTDPKSKQFKKPHTCKYLHPGEAGWLPQWNTDRTYKPAAPAPVGVDERWFALKGGVGIKPVAVRAVTQQPKKAVNQWAALEEDEKTAW